MIGCGLHEIRRHRQNAGAEFGGERANLMHAIRRVAILALAAILVTAAISPAAAQHSATTVFTVRVPPRMMIAAPSGTESLTHNGTEADQAFAVQRWTVDQNNPAGAVVTFATEYAFTSTDSAGLKRDARLDLSLDTARSASTWSVSVPSDQTDYASAAEVAKVQAASAAPGSAAFDLTVTFLTGDVITLASGDYLTTVTETVTAN